MDSEIITQLKTKAKEASKNSYAPYSKFPVAAALVSTEGRIFTGVNVENASYGLTMCAERNAIFAGVTQGSHTIEAIVIYTPTSKPTPPCGACRQVIIEFSKTAKIISICDSDEELQLNASQLLPHSFEL